MRKLIVKTVLITLGIMLILAVAVFGIASFVAPSAMMRFFDSLGLETISGDYAYQQYQISDNLDYLARAFEIAAANNNDSVAAQRFDEFYGEEESEQREAFYTYCENQSNRELPGGAPDYDYRSFVCGQAAIAKYRLSASSSSNEGKEEICAFALFETGEEFVEESPIVALSLDAIEKGDGEFCALLLRKIREEKRFNAENEIYINIVKGLEEVANE